MSTEVRGPVASVVISSGTVISGAVLSVIVKVRLKLPFIPPYVAVSVPDAGIEQLISFIFHVNASPPSAPSSSTVSGSSKIMSNE